MTVINQASGDLWTLLHADSVEALPDLPAESIGLIVYSPPFADLYV